MNVEPAEWSVVTPLLVGHLSPGVWRADDVQIHPATMAEVAADVGWTVRHGRLPVGDDKAAYITALAALGGAPSYVRGNWDSLADGLTDLAGDGPTLLVVESPEPTSFDGMAVEILDEACRWWDEQRRPIHVVWFGTVDAPSLTAVGPLRAIRADRGARTGKTPDR